MLSKIHETGKPLILVLMNGRAITINWANKNCNAIIEAWFPGKYGSEAIADVVFGDYNPGGKLTVTFPKSVGQIPDVFSSKTKCTGSSQNNGKRGIISVWLWLSYTTFEYSNLKIIPEKQIAAGTLKSQLM